MIILQVLWFFLPAGVANMAPIIIKKVPFFDPLDIPIDGHKTFRGKRIFGDHKTVRGFFIGYLTAAITALLQFIAYERYEFIQEISLINYAQTDMLWWAFLLGFGALAGDAIKSFFKRQKSHPPGTAWVPFDQIDYIVGGIAGSLLVTTLTPLQYVVLVAVWVLAHPLFTWLGYTLGLKESAI